MLAFFKKHLLLKLERKTLEENISFLRYYDDEIIINTKHCFYMDEKFLNYFAMKMILLNILQNVKIYLFKYFVSYITVIPRNDTSFLILCVTAALRLNL